MRTLITSRSHVSYSWGLTCPGSDSLRRPPSSSVHHVPARRLDGPAAVAVVVGAWCRDSVTVTPELRAVHNRPTGPAETLRPAAAASSTARTTTDYSPRSTRVRTTTTTKQPYSGTRPPVRCGGASRLPALRSRQAHGLSQWCFREHARVSSQGRGVPEARRRRPLPSRHPSRRPRRGDIPPLPRTTAELLTDAIRAAAGKVHVDGPVIDGRAQSFAFGRQLDGRSI